MDAKDKSQTLSPYQCKKESEIQVIQNTLNRVDKKIDLLIETNQKISVQEEKIKNLEIKMDSLTNKLWAILFIAITAIITSLFKLIL